VGIFRSCCTAQQRETTLNMMKRKRTDLTWWEEPFKKWMQSNGGFVHSNIELLEDRELFCEKKVDPDTIILSTDPDGVVTTTSTIFFLPNMQFESIKLP
jgi:hypothetical protein